MTNLVISVQIGAPKPYFQYADQTWSSWCKRQGVLYERLTFAPEELHPRMAKWVAFNRLNQDEIEVDQLAIVDADTMIRWDCPDFFQLTNHRLAAVLDLGDVQFVLESLEACQQLFAVEVNWWEYVNSGLVIVNRNHQPLAEAMLAFGRKHLAGSYGKSIDQTPLNYFIRQLNLQVTQLPAPFNLTKIKERKLLPADRYLEAGYVWHFNSESTDQDKFDIMEQTWQKIARHYQ